MQHTPLPAPLQQFVDDLNALLEAGGDESLLLPQVGTSMRTLVAEDNWLPPSHAQPHPEYYRQYLLYADPAERFSVVSFVWGPGQSTPIHDHTVWGVIGMLRGAEFAQNYSIAADGTPALSGGPVKLSPGDAEFVSPSLGDVHKVWNAYDDEVSISIHAYGGNIGKIRRHVFPPEGGASKDFVSGYSSPLPTQDFDGVRSKLLQRGEVALLDVREEAPHAQGHPLFAANLPLSRIELDAYTKLPRRDVPIVAIDQGEGQATLAAQRLLALGYTDVAVFAGGIGAWKSAGGELFIDVNVPSKAFGELMELACHTPSLSAQEVKALIDSQADMVVVDARRFDEYQTMSIPTGISVPGAELVLRTPDLAPRPETRIIVNCAGRTRSLIGAQSLINAGLPNPVAALRNGTIGWTLAQQALDSGQSRRFPPTPGGSQAIASQRARAVADRAGVKRTGKAKLADWAGQQGRTTYFFDVRSLAEYEIGHLPGFYPIPGGQLVQETEMYAPVRGARIVLADDDGARANMTASWLAQMAWDVYVVDGLGSADFTEVGSWLPLLPALPENRPVSPATLHGWLQAGDVVVLDAAKHAAFKKGHIPGAWYVLRSQLGSALPPLPKASRYVVACADGLLSQLLAAELAGRVGGEVFVLAGGTPAWVQAGYALEGGETRLASRPIDRYQRPYEGTDAPAGAMQAYLDWEFGLIGQLHRDGTHHFQPLAPL